MNTTMSNMVNLAINYETDMGSNLMGSGNGGSGFLSTLKGLMNSHGPSNLENSMASRPPLSGQESETHSYLESLRKTLLSRGKPLDQISLNRKDLPMLRKFLHQCGFSKEDVEKFLKDLLEKNPLGEINLSQFFLKMADLAPHGRGGQQAVTLEPSAILHIESALRGFGLSSKELEHAINAAAVKGGGLDLNRFVMKLKTIGHRAGEGTHGFMDQNHKEAGKVTIRDFIASLERMAGRSGRGDRVPEDVRATIGQILESANGDKEKPVMKGELMDLLSSLKEAGGVKMEDMEPKLDIPDLANKTRLLADLEALRGLKDEIKEHRLRVRGEFRSEKTAVPITRPVSVSIFSESVNRIKQNQEPVKTPMPAYLIDQVGRKLSRSILKGDRVVKLQLKPPELGAMKVEMDMKGNILKLGMIAENSSVKELLMSHVHELREALVEQGVKLDRVDVQINYNFGQSLANLKEGPKGGRRWNQGKNGNGFMEEHGRKDAPGEPLMRISKDHLLDLTA